MPEEIKNSNMAIIIIVALIIVVLGGLNIWQFSNRVSTTAANKKATEEEFNKACDAKYQPIVENLSTKWEGVVLKTRDEYSIALKQCQEGKKVTPPEPPKTITVKEFIPVSTPETSDPSDMDAHKKRMQEMLDGMSKDILNLQQESQKEKTNE